MTVYGSLKSVPRSSFTSFYQVLPGLASQVYQDLPGFTRSRQPGLPGFTRFYQDLPGLTRRYQDLPGVTRIYEDLRGLTRSYQVLLGRQAARPLAGCWAGGPLVDNYTAGLPGCQAAQPLCRPAAMVKAGKPVGQVRYKSDLKLP